MICSTAALIEDKPEPINLPLGYTRETRGRAGPARAHIRQLGKDNVTAPRALALSDKQLALLQRAAASLPVGERDHFLQSVAAHLSGQPTDDAVIAAINAALDAAAVAGELEEEASMSMSPLLFRRSLHGRAGLVLSSA